MQTKPSLHWDLQDYVTPKSKMWRQECKSKSFIYFNFSLKNANKPLLGEWINIRAESIVSLNYVYIWGGGGGGGWKDISMIGKRPNHIFQNSSTNEVIDNGST